MLALARRLTLLACLLPVLLLCAAPAGAIEMRTYGKPFCEGIPVHDYQRVFESMPAIREAPIDHDLPFGPRNLSIYERAITPVIVGRGGFGYGLFDETFGVREEVRLFWDVTATLSRIGARGQVLRVIDSKSQYLGVLKQVDEDFELWLDTPPGPALYRYDIEFRDHRTGEVLGQYGKYLRVVKPTYHPRIAVNRGTAKRGQTVYARVENHGTEWLFFGLPFGVQHFVDGAWRPVPERGSGIWPAVGLGMGSGGTGWCMRYPIPADAAPGIYRFVKSIAPWGRERRDRRYTAGFRVTG